VWHVHVAAGGALHSGLPLDNFVGDGVGRRLAMPRNASQKTPACW
jgi:hypothetical protein